MILILYDSLVNFVINKSLKLLYVCMFDCPFVLYANKISHALVQERYVVVTL